MSTGWPPGPEPSPLAQSPSRPGSRSGSLALPAPGRWDLDPGNCAVHAIIRHAIFTKVRISFRVVNGTMEMAADPEQSWVHAEIRAASADSGDPTRDARIRDADFLDTDRYPGITFRSTLVSSRAGNDWDVHGELTIRDRTNPVSLLTRYHGVRLQPNAAPRARFAARTSIARDAYGLTWNQALDTGGLVLGQTVTVELDIEAVRYADSAGTTATSVFA